MFLLRSLPYSLRGLRRQWRNGPRGLATVQGQTSFGEETDVLIIGSGAGGLVASLRAKTNGLNVIVAEKCKTIGGSSVMSGGALWIPMNPLERAAGIHDDHKSVLKYFEQAVGDVGPASSIARRRAFVDNAAKMIEFLQSLGFRFRLAKDYPDYYPWLEGAIPGGRSVESELFDTKKLGDWQKLLPPTNVPLAFHMQDNGILTRMASSPSAMAQSLYKIIPTMVRNMLGQKLTGMGHALVAQLLYLNRELKADIRTENSLVEFIKSPDGAIFGANFKTPAGLRAIHAKRGILLATGGFAHNLAMRQQHLPAPVSTEWSSSHRDDTGDGIRAGMCIGAATALLDDAWWGPTFFDPVTGRPVFTLSERARPYCIIVDSMGSRFMNEAQSYTDAGHAMYARNREVATIPAWFVMDANHRKRYPLGSLLARMEPPKQALAEGRMFKADTIKDLAAQIGISPGGLANTVSRYNEMSRKGIDEDFGKGNNVYNSYFGDPAVSPNSNMGPLEKVPFYAVPIWPGDLGTKGGLLADEFQRVIKEDGSVIQGLYACGNTAASIMGRAYLGAGATLGPATTHAFIAVNHMANAS
ncbi:FAD binding domain-containing protein [Mycena albidolilacea]|uniref:FAD binding domain-containing protein n=1 Tax=Mycena albidolilacea TaxID=1033008 RepID=A0AAD7EX96_9AGAR|nr:FAD binding domain-containing protein [Mycena albidolilacea]